MPKSDDASSSLGYEHVSDELANELMARHVEVNTLADMMGHEKQRSTPIPALYNMWYRFIQNPSTVTVETMKRMVDTDETLGSGVDFLVSCLVARLGAYQHTNPEITKFVTRALEEIEGGFTDACKELLSACWNGFSVSEIVWANKNIGFVPIALAPMPATTVLFEVDRTGRLTDDGILQYQRNFGTLAGIGSGWGTGLNGFSGRPDPLAKFGDLAFPIRTGNMFNYLSVRIPRMKCIHFAWNGPGRFGNPYGRSMLRRAYNWWVQKWAYTQMMGTALDRKGTPLNVVFADMSVSILKDPAQSGSSEKRGKRDTIPATQAAAEAFRNIHNDTTVVLPGKKDQVFSVDQLTQDANVDGFVDVLQFCNSMLMRALLIPSLIFTSGDGTGSYALGQEHAKTFDKLLDSFLEGFKKTLIDQLVRQIVAYNFPKEVWQEQGLGTFAKRELTVDERQKEGELFSSAITNGVVDTNDLADLNKMREALGFEPRTETIPKPMPADPFGGLFGGEQDGVSAEQEGAEGPTADEDQEQPPAAGRGVRPVRGPAGDGGRGGPDGGGRPGRPGAGSTPAGQA